MRFISYQHLLQRFGAPAIQNYIIVFVGDLGTTDLEQIYTIYRNTPPSDDHGYKMAVSDVVELYDSFGRAFYYCDHVGFRPIYF